MTTVRLIGPGDVADRLDRMVLIDVRESAERLRGYIGGSDHIPMGELIDALPDHVSSMDTDIVLYCATGVRSAVATALIEGAGYRSVSSMEGGFEQWQSEKRSWVNPTELSDEQIRRYSRHINLPDVGLAGQTKLLHSRVGVVGAGGLGSPVLLYLAAAGIGTLGVVDYDTVDETNLQRQVIHGLDRVGRPKTESVRERLMGLNPDVKVEIHDERLQASNAIRILSGYDIVVDATDNFPTRYLINDVSLHLRIPVVHASIYRFEGQVSVFAPFEGPCYRCLFAAPPPAELAASCDTGGVLGVLPGVIGSLQATEVIKLALGIGEPLIGRLMFYDALTQEMSDVNVGRDPSCAACRDESTPPILVDYDDACLPA